MELQAVLEKLENGMRLQLKGYADLIRKCARPSHLAQGRRLHAHLHNVGYFDNNLPFLGNLLIQMYGKCGSLEDARSCFAKIPQPNSHTWTMLVSAYAQTGHLREAIAVLGFMTLEGFKPIDVTFLVALDACCKLDSLGLGRRLHDVAVSGGFCKSILVSNALINMYGKCRSLEEARRVFDAMPYRDLITWNSMIVSYAQNECGDEALELFEQMDVEPDRVTFVGLADACGCTFDLDRSRKLHVKITSSGIRPDVILHNTILKMYGKCKSLQDARALFDTMEERNVVSWNIMMRAYIRSGLPAEALGIFQGMVQEGVQWDVSSSIAALDLCASLKAFPQGREVHDSIVPSDLRHVSLGNAVLNMYTSCGRYEDARRFFDGMQFRDDVSWTSMVAVCVQSGKHGEALEYYRHMNLEGKRPDKITTLAALEACIKLGALSDGKAVHASILDLEAADAIIANNLMAMYSKCGHVKLARQVFDSVPHKNLFSWTIMMSSYSSDGHDAEAIKLFYSMLNEETIVVDNIAFSTAIHACANCGALDDGRAFHDVLVSSGFEPDAVLESTLLNMYSRCGSLYEARQVFRGMRRRVTGSWNAMMTAYIQNDKPSDAMALFEEMQRDESVKPDKVTYLLALSCCANKTLAEKGKDIHARAMAAVSSSSYDDEDDNSVRDNYLSNTLIDVYSKCGLLNNAREMFEQMPHKDVFTWSVMIRSYARCGQGPKSLELFGIMRQHYTEPNEVTFLEVMSVCSHLGLLREAREFHLAMQEDHGLEPNRGHYSCLVDLLARSGKLEAVEDLVENMPFQPDHIIMTSLLGACSTHGDIKRGIRAAKYVFNLETREQTAYILLSSLHAVAGMVQEAETIKKAVQQNTRV